MVDYSALEAEALQAALDAAMADLDSAIAVGEYESLDELTIRLEEEMQSQFDLRDALQDIVSDAGFNDEGVRDWLEEKQQIWADMETRH